MWAGPQSCPHSHRPAPGRGPPADNTIGQGVSYRLQDPERRSTMTYHDHYTLSDDLLDRIQQEGLAALPELVRIVVNTAMLAERQQYLGAGPYERSPERTDQANGFKPKTVKTRVGEVTFAIPQVRNGDFY